MKRGLKIIPVSTADDILKNALVSPLTSIEWDEDEMEAALASSGEEDDVSDMVTH